MTMVRDSPPLPGRHARGPARAEVDIFCHSCIRGRSHVDLDGVLNDAHGGRPSSGMHGRLVCGVGAAAADDGDEHDDDAGVDDEDDDLVTVGPRRAPARAVRAPPHGEDGGTSLNGDLACGFERVCGHKGYSYDAYQLEVRKAAGFSPYANYGRPHSGNYKHAEEDKIGYEDCDFISKEVNWAFWKQFQNWSIPLQLHVPCRKPIDLLMSMCNFRKFRFNCSRPAVAQVDYCSLVVGPSDGGDSQYWFDRWNRALRNATNTFVKCYRFEDQFTRYVPHMRSLLQKKRFPADFKFVKMNRKRKDECIYAPENAGLRASVVKYLLERWDYNQFCYECIGSEDDLFAK
eukprot:CAMPEP_0198515824 /NCGR_PEP_ID=MMETSP1462-20131121/17546_1 /TAXON_ID=1333877 /ORGANISM="Brandtodinium nutriculum, Strain RCC3387" /LENGTH=344 /DNA_ID=CAMNT_0044245331 /DNA_START=25 /DNA_END=1060 /DNA_ORIENTATION=-